ncbi:MAG TPA: DEAD/DEAH box helicase [Steroidobacteraceae bacterium]|nr:DEAD/DEAH box helicase [Steroidobacteraceae bacterium]
MSALESFHPAVSAWFARAFPAPTPAQEQAWPALQAGRPVLIAAPTGSGKTFAGFLAAIDQLVREGLESALPDETRVVYVSPLKALSNDVQRNLSAPLAGIRDELAAQGLPPLDIRASVRTGDTAQAERALMRRNPPHIIVTTPESLYILLGSESGRRMLATTRTVIVDEIHALAGSKRGAHLALSLERLEALAGRTLTRIGLSATQKPLDEVARFLLGDRRLQGAIIDAGHTRSRDLKLELPPAPLEAVMSGEGWTQIYDRLAELVREHRTTLVFVNTRRLAERIARHLSERLGAEFVTSHHGSLARDRRLDAEQRLKRGELRALVATASLELGIDIGDVDLVCQISSPRSINAFLQRVGRAGHAVGGTSKGRLFPLSRDDLVECAALLAAVHRGELDRLSVPEGALDVLAQQIAAEVGARECAEDELYGLIRRAWPYRNLARHDFDAIVEMLAAGFTTRRGRRGALIHHDSIQHQLRPRRGTRLTALTSGGAIPDTADYQVMLEPDGHPIGSVHEDFAVESLQGDVFQLGNASYRILRVERGTVRVEDAKGMPPSIPFWLGEAPGRTDELSLAVSQLRAALDERLNEGRTAALEWFTTAGIDLAPAAQLVDYLASARAALGCLPTQETVVFERFFDESGGMQLVIHAPYGSRVNRAWGLALRKRFCRQFNFELQAAATEDCLVLSLTTSHSFELAEVAKYLHSNSVQHLLVQALCAAPMFTTRWRWTAAIALALPRFRGGRRVPPQIARMHAEDLLASVFPDQVACAENLSGEIEIPDHPLVQQAIRDCLTDAMDFEHFLKVLLALEAGKVRVVARDLTEPSPLALEVLSARPYAFLDDAPLEERRTQAVMSRRWIDPQSAADLGRLDPEAIARVREEAWPDAASADELHDALLWMTCLTHEEAAANPAWPPLLATLQAQGRVLGLSAPVLWIATERRALFESADEAALIEIVRGRLEGSGPVTAAALAATLGQPPARIDAALLALQSEGAAMRGRFTAGADSDEWCDRRLLARIHRYTVKRLRAEIEPVSTRDFLNFLIEWQHVGADSRLQGPDAVAAVLTQLEGFDAPAGAWETEILPSRIAQYDPAWLDEHCVAGRFLWARLAPRSGDAARGAAPVRTTPIALIGRRNVRLWAALAPAPDPGRLSGAAAAVRDYLNAQGASFFDEITDGAQLLPAQAEDALAELVALGVVHCDSFNGLRTLLLPAERRRRGHSHRRLGRGALFGMSDAGRWSLVRRAAAVERPEAIEHLVRTLLKRWGVIFWRMLAREGQWLPPWRELLGCCRTLEARGELRGGRFIAGISGEQYALPEAIGLLREARKGRRSLQDVAISAADPLNLMGITTPGPRVPALTANRVLYRDGLPLATLTAGETEILRPLPDEELWPVRNAILRRGVPSALTELI